MSLEAYSNLDWTQCIDTRCETTEVIFLVNGSPVHYISSKQPTIAHSSTEAELVAANVAARDLTWFQKLSYAWKVPFSTAAHRIDDKLQREIIDGKQVERIGTIALGIENKGCVDFAHANGVTKLSKHLDIKHKYLQQQVKAGHVRLTQISTADQKADFLTAEAYPLHASMRCTSPHLMTSEGNVAQILAYTLATGQNVARRL
jgi:hypothetical protein